MAGIIVSVLAVIGLVAYIFAIFFFDHLRRKQGKPSVFLDECESEGRGKRLVRAYQKKYGKKAD